MPRSGGSTSCGRGGLPIERSCATRCNSGSNRPGRVRLRSFLADGVEEPFDVGILPRRPRGTDDFFDAEALDAFRNDLAVDRVAFELQELGRRVERKDFVDLLRGPPRRGVRLMRSFGRPWPGRKRLNSKALSQPTVIKVFRPLSSESGLQTHTAFSFRTPLYGYVGGAAGSIPAASTLKPVS